MMEIAPRKLGSFEDWVVAFVREGARRGHSIEVLGKAPAHATFLAELGRHGANWGTLDANGIGASWAGAIAYLRQFDVLHLSFFQPYRLWTYLAALAWPARVLLQDHYSGPLPGELSWRSALKNRFRASPALWRVSQVAGVSRYVTDRDAWLYGLPKRKLRTIYNGVSLSRFYPPGSGEARQPAESLLSVAQLHQVKGVDHLIRAIGILNDPDLHLSLAGEGPEASNLRQLVSTLGLENQVSFLGLRDDVPDLERRAGIFVHPAIWEEAFGLGIAEAMASGCAVIASRVGAIPELVEDGVTGLLVPPSDPAALAAAIRRLLEDPGLRQRLATAARACVEERFELSRAVDAHLDWCETMGRR